MATLAPGALAPDVGPARCAGEVFVRHGQDYSRKHGSRAPATHRKPKVRLHQPFGLP